MTSEMTIAEKMEISLDKMLEKESQEFRDNVNKMTEAVLRDVEVNRNNVEYFYPIVAWRKNYDKACENLIRVVQRELKHQPKLKWSKKYFIECAFCNCFFRSACGEKFHTGVNEYGYPVSYQGCDCAATTFSTQVPTGRTYSRETSSETQVPHAPEGLRHMQGQTRNFVSCTYGSLLDGDILMFTDIPPVPEGSNMCDYCIVEYLKKGDLRVVYSDGSGHVTHDLEEYYPSDEEIESFIKSRNEKNGTQTL